MRDQCFICLTQEGLIVVSETIKEKRIQSKNCLGYVRCLKKNYVMKLNIGIGDDMKNIDDFIKQISFEILSKDLKSKDVSLLKGKMGLVILFYELNSVYQQKDYELFAESLFEDILEIGNNIHFPIRFDGGLLDYGLGLEYLMGRGFLIIDNDAKE